MIEFRHARLIELFWKARYDVRAVGSSARRAFQIFSDVLPHITSGKILNPDQSRVLMAHGLLPCAYEPPQAFQELANRLDMSPSEVAEAYSRGVEEFAASPDIESVMALHGVYKERGHSFGPQVEVNDAVLQFELPTFTADQRQ